SAAFRDENPLSFLGEVRQQPIGFARIAGLLVDERPDRHGEFEIVAVVSGTVGPHSVFATLGRELRVEPVVNQRVGVWAGDDEDRAAVPAVAAARATTRHVFLATEGETAFAAVTCFDVNIDFVNEHNEPRMW